MDRIQFKRSVEKAGFYSPLAGMEFAEQTIEVRRDPLLGTTAFSSSELATKEEMFFGKTDWEHTEQLAAATRTGCFFCPEKVFEVTPRYPEELLAGGRLQRGRALVFPNLFPLARLHAVVTYPEHHFLRPSQFTPDLLRDGLGAAVELCRRAESFYPDLEHLEICCNHMLPAGASMVHPHFQIFGGPAVPWLVQTMWDRSAVYAAEHGISYWEALVEQETTSGERFIAAQDGVTWLVAYAPLGGREVLAVVPGRARVGELDDAQVGALARGLSRVVAWYERESLSAFNFTLYGGPSDGPESGHPVVLRVIARSAFKPDYRTDDYFLQKQLGGELIFSPPEQIAATLRSDFAQA
jgi:UDPglucose--hexose-1-phosphate uridylyltransferase